MRNKLKNQQGITLMALIITIIVLIIIAGIGIAESLNDNGSVEQSQDAIAKAELSKIQQAVLENYVKYMQTKNIQYLRGEEMSYADAEEAIGQFNGATPKQQSYNTNEALETHYYKINRTHLTEMGLKKITNNDEYLINYATGEVYNLTQKNTIKGEALYIYGTN